MHPSVGKKKKIKMNVELTPFHQRVTSRTCWGLAWWRAVRTSLWSYAPHASLNALTSVSPNVGNNTDSEFQFNEAVTHPWLSELKHVSRLGCIGGIVIFLLQRVFLFWTLTSSHLRGRNSWCLPPLLWFAFMCRLTSCVFFAQRGCPVSIQWQNTAIRNG